MEIRNEGRSVFEVEDDDLPELPGGAAAHLLGENERRHVRRARWLAGQILTQIEPSQHAAVARALRELIEISHWAGTSFSGARASEICAAVTAEARS